MASTIWLKSKFLKPFLLSVVIWTTLHGMFIYWLGYSMNTAIADSIVFNFLLADFCLGQLFIMQYYQPKKEKAAYILISSTIIALTATFISNYLLSLFHFEDADYNTFIVKSIPVRIVVAFLFAAIMNMISMLVNSMEAQKADAMRRHEAEQLSKEAELYNLRSQLQPHFLFNSLNSISALAGSKPDEARNMVQQLSDFLRGTIRKDNAQLIPLKDELHHLNLYLEIEMVRFGHRLAIDMICDENCGSKKIPSLLLQPILENAIKFGLYDTLENVTISIIATVEDNNLIIKITNPYDKTSSPPQKGTGFGLSAVQRRLFLLYSRNDLLQTIETDNVFTTIIKIPQPAI